MGRPAKATITNTMRFFITCKVQARYYPQMDEILGDKRQREATFAKRAAAMEKEWTKQIAALADEYGLSPIEVSEIHPKPVSVDARFYRDTSSDEKIEKINGIVHEKADQIANYLASAIESINPEK